jgi:hypothetical protein
VGGEAYQHFAYAIHVDLAGTNARLLDANIRYSVAPMATVWFGQGEAPFKRQQFTSSGNLQMVDRAITDGRFAPGRQVGIALAAPWCVRPRRERLRCIRRELARRQCAGGSPPAMLKGTTAQHSSQAGRLMERSVYSPLRANQSS